jgi:hypothetical protein
MYRGLHPRRRRASRKNLLQSELPQLWALNSAVECHLHTVEVTGSNPVAPTNLISLKHSHLRVAVVFAAKIPARRQPDESHCVASDAGLAASNCSMYWRCASNALGKSP